MIDSEQSAFDLRVRPHCCWDPLTEQAGYGSLRTNRAAFLKFNVFFGQAAPLLQILGILRNDVHVHRRRLPQEAMHCRQVKVFAPVPDRRTPENYLCNVF